MVLKAKKIGDIFARIKEKILPSRVWEFVHIIIGHSITYECPIVL